MVLVKEARCVRIVGNKKYRRIIISTYYKEAPHRDSRVYLMFTGNTLICSEETVTPPFVPDHT